MNEVELVRQSAQGQHCIAAKHDMDPNVEVMHGQ